MRPGGGRGAQPHPALCGGGCSLAPVRAPTQDAVLAFPGLLYLKIILVTRFSRRHVLPASDLPKTPSRYFFKKSTSSYNLRVMERPVSSVQVDAIRQKSPPTCAPHVSVPQRLPRPCASPRAPHAQPGQSLRHRLTRATPACAPCAATPGARLAAVRVGRGEAEARCRGRRGASHCTDEPERARRPAFHRVRAASVWTPPSLSGDLTGHTCPGGEHLPLSALRTGGSSGPQLPISHSLGSSVQRNREK